jgi:hypothetical protein
LRRRITPQKKTPRKNTPKKYTPKKRTPKKTTSKSALRRSGQKLSNNEPVPKQLSFLSPEHSNNCNSNVAALRTKRALFISPIKEADETENLKSSLVRNDRLVKRIKLDTTDLSNSVPRGKLQKSLSFAGDKVNHSFQESKQLLTRYASESLPNKPGELSAHHKQKLLWAVSVALKSHDVGVNHQDFRKYFSSLARLTQKLSQLPYNARLLSTPGNSTSDTFLK